MVVVVVIMVMMVMVMVVPMVMMVVMVIVIVVLSHLQGSPRRIGVAAIVLRPLDLHRIGNGVK